MTKFAAVLDFETTGMDPAAGRIIEGAVALVELRPDRTLGETVETYSSFNDPGFPIPPEIVKLTGITDEMIKGHSLDWSRFNSLLERAVVLVSHNVAFDRPWLERYGEFLTRNSGGARRWACSLKMIDWNAAHGLPCRTLKHLAWEHDHFPNAHRAIDDVDTLVHLLRLPTKGDPGRTYMQELLGNAALSRRIVFATGAPFESKDLLKERGFRWSPERRVWWKIATDEDLSTLEKFLEENVYGGRPRHTVSDPVDTLDPAAMAQHGLA